MEWLQRVTKGDKQWLRMKNHSFIWVASHPSRLSLYIQSALWQWSQETPTGWQQTHRSHRQPWARSVGRFHMTDTHNKECWEFGEQGLALPLWDRMTRFCWSKLKKKNPTHHSTLFYSVVWQVYDDTGPVYLQYINLHAKGIKLNAIQRNVAMNSLCTGCDIMCDKKMFWNVAQRLLYLYWEGNIQVYQVCCNDMNKCKKNMYHWFCG